MRGAGRHAINIATLGGHPSNPSGWQKESYATERREVGKRFFRSHRMHSVSASSGDQMDYVEKIEIKHPARNA